MRSPQKGMVRLGGGREEHGGAEAYGGGGQKGRVRLRRLRATSVPHLMATVPWLPVTWPAARTKPGHAGRAPGGSPRSLQGETTRWLSGGNVGATCATQAADRLRRASSFHQAGLATASHCGWMSLEKLRRA